MTGARTATHRALLCLAKLKTHPRKTNQYVWTRQCVTISTSRQAYYQAFCWVLIDLIIQLVDLVIKPFDNEKES
jgi:hypothetical protein